MADDAAEACVMNIGPNERKNRMRFGIVAIVLGLVGAGALLWFRVPELYRLGLFLPFWVGGIGVFQAREKT